MADLETRLNEIDGRKSRLDEKIKENAGLKSKLTAHKKRFNSMYKFLLQAGMIEADISEAFGMNRDKYVIDKARKKEPDLQKSHEDAMSSLEANLTSRIVSQAIGYDYTEEKVTYEKEDDEWVEKKKEVCTKHNPGSPKMMAYLMNNRFSENWKETKELVTKKEGYDANPADRHRKQIESLATDVLEADTAESEGEHSLSDSPAPVSS